MKTAVFCYTPSPTSKEMRECMAKRKDKREATELYTQVLQTAAQTLLPETGELRNRQGDRFLDDVLAAIEEIAVPTSNSSSQELTKMKKFRFQLLHEWISTNLEPGRMADVGGGKGLLAYLLQGSGWTTTVIDPIDQALPTKYKDLATNKQTAIAETERVSRINAEFEPSMAQNFDLLVAMHAHGCNIQLIDAAIEYDCDLILLPCCVIHEPILPPPGEQWIQWLVELVIEKGFTVVPFRLNFKGQNIGIYARPQARSLG